MRSTQRLISYAALAIATISCGPSVRVRTMVAPDAKFTALRTFRILERVFNPVVLFAPGLQLDDLLLLRELVHLGSPPAR